MTLTMAIHDWPHPLISEFLITSNFGQKHTSRQKTDYGDEMCNLPYKPIAQPYEDSLVPRPHLRERVWWHPADTSGFINIDYFLERNISPPITLQKRQSVVQHRKFLASSARWHSTFLACKLVIGSQLCIQQAMNFNEAQGITQMSPDPLRAGGVWARDYLAAM